MGSETVKVIEESRVDGFRGLIYLHVTENMTESGLIITGSLFYFSGLNSVA